MARVTFPKWSRIQSDINVQYPIGIPMKKHFHLIALALFFIGTRYEISPAQPRDSDYLFAPDSLDTPAGEDRIGVFIEDLLQKIEDGVQEMAKEKSYDHGDEFDSTHTSRRFRSQEGAVTFSGNTSIDANDKIEGNVVVKGGTLTVTGLVQGDALAINGDIIVKDGGRITGNARSMNGKVIKEGGGIIDGYAEESTSARDTRLTRRMSVPKRSYRFNEYWLDESLFPDNFVFRYNRVEGLFLGLGSEKKFYWDGSRVFSGYGSAGYAFKIHRWRLNLGLDRQFAAENALYEVGAEGHSVTDTKDEWIMKLSENNVVAFLWHEDYRDYYAREGFALHAARYTKERGFATQLRVDYLIDDYSSLSKETEWSLFRPSHSFRENPAVEEGTMHSLIGTAGLSTLERFGRKTVGWNFFASAERGGGALGGHFNFTQVIFDLRRFQPLSEYDNVNVRVRVGSLGGDYIPQKSFEIGGANTLPAFGYKEFGGNRMVLGNFEYTVSGRLLDDVAFWPNSLNLMLLADAGATSRVSEGKKITEGFPSISSKTVKSDIGFAVGWHDESWRMGFVWRTDVGSPVSVFLRLNKPF